MDMECLIATTTDLKQFNLPWATMPPRPESMPPPPWDWAGGGAAASEQEGKYLSKAPAKLKQDMSKHAETQK